VSRNFGGIRDRAAENKRIRKARERPPPVAVTYRCPECGGDHPAADHGLTDSLRDALRTLPPGELRELELAALGELTRAVVAGDADLVSRISLFVRRVEARMQAFDD
jgi:hypothetical protein